MARAESSYVLVSENRNVDLRKHIGKRVEVTGTFDSSRSGHGAHTGSQPGSQSSQSSSSAGTSSSASSSGTVTGQSGMMSEHHQIKVKSIRQIASSCQ